MKFRKSAASLAAGIALTALVAGLAQAQEADGKRLLELAAQGRTGSVLELLDEQTEVNAIQADGSTLLHWAIYYDDPRLARRLIEAGADVGAENQFGATPMSQAAITGNAEILRMLLEAGVDPDTPGHDGQTPLMVLARTDNLDAASVLLEAGADPNVQEQWRGQSALMWAAAQQQPDMVQVLLEHGADADAQSMPNDWKRQVTAEPRMKVLPAGGLTPLLYAAREGCADCVRHLIEAGADLNKSDPEMMTPLVMATLNAQWDAARLLVEAGADVNKWDIWGRNPLYATVDYNTLPHGGRADRLADDLTGSFEMIRILLESGANPNLQLKLFPPYRSLGADRGADGVLRTGVTPLFRAARGGDIPAMQLLLEHGAIPDLPNVDDVTPLMVATGYRASDIDTRGRFRTEKEAYEAAKLLLESGEAGVNARAEDGQTALYGAATRGYASVVELLAQHGADLEMEDNNGATPLDAAMGRAGRFGRGAGGEAHVEVAALLERLIAERHNNDG